LAKISFDIRAIIGSKTTLQTHLNPLFVAFRPSQAFHYSKAGIIIYPVLYLELLIHLALVIFVKLSYDFNPMSLKQALINAHWDLI
jgi:hypothetical protein